MSSTSADGDPAAPDSSGRGRRLGSTDESLFRRNGLVPEQTNVPRSRTASDQALERLLGLRVLARVQRPDEPPTIEIEDDRVAVGERPARHPIVVSGDVAEHFQRQAERCTR